MESSPRTRLLQQAEKILLHPIHPHLISYCPTMDLIAIVTDEENLDVYRINGQRAFGLKRKNSDASIDCICWEFNGQAIAVAWSDGYTDILSSETGKVIHKDLPPPTSKLQTTRIQCIGWGLNFIDVEAVKRRTGLSKKRKVQSIDVGATPSSEFGVPTTEEWDAFRDGTTLEDFLQRQPDLQALDVAPDLPNQLAMMDMETLLPKLPAIPLPPAQPFMRAPPADSGAFSTQVQVDSLLHSHHMKDQNSVDMFIRCTDLGTVHPSIYDSLETVDVRLPPAWSMESKTLMHTSHPYSCSHGLLVEAKAANNAHKKLAYIPLTLGFIPSAGIYLHLIASKTSQLQNLLLYLQQCLQRIRTFWKHSQDLPTKFMMNISETLEEKGQGNLVQNLYHLACTGTCSPMIKEWLVDELAEQGHKRWDHTVSTSLTTLLALVHENLLPALDRCSIVISRLRGLAQYHDQGWIFSGPVSDFSALLIHIKNLRLLAHTTLLYAGDSKRQFLSFSKWLRFCIDFEATELDSQSRQEMENRDPGVDIGMVLEYIQYGLTRSDLGPFLKTADQLEPKQRNSGPESYADTRKAIELLKEEGGYKTGALCMDLVLQHFGEGCKALLKQTSAWQESNTTMDCGLVLEAEPLHPEAMDMRMVFTPSQATANDAISTYISTVLESQPGQLNMHRLTHAPSITGLPTDLLAYAATILAFPDGAKVLDAKFVDDEEILVLLSYEAAPDAVEGEEEKKKKKKKDAATTTTTCVLLSIPYIQSRRTTTTSSSATTTTTTTTTRLPIPSQTIPFNPLPPTSFPSHLLPSGSPTPLHLRTRVFVTPEWVEQCTRHVFERRFTPLKMVVNGRKGRRVVVVLGSDMKHYRVLDLDFKGKKTEDDEGKDVGERGEDADWESSSGDIEMIG
ncbi:hypothetical protein K504DRAFT_457593 [Pleomassaria siparia CBS 279.74]|uniref:Anaphase-promoting complex subunit 4 n=1 Tax=Pleomassaria siparia CBS 279.74 TaxID=1314801 RepID=A0A6G1KSX7_9PLEO|nr:hypothetical protein K504DRAFT_457593 [Pleomassaria siparia CBS 279.74]